ncbi:Uncharacterized protein DAT39_003143, partial [Clarias magur]
MVVSTTRSHQPAHSSMTTLSIISLVVENFSCSQWPANAKMSIKLCTGGLSAFSTM